MSDDPRSFEHKPDDALLQRQAEDFAHQDDKRGAYLRLKNSLGRQRANLIVGYFLRQSGHQHSSEETAALLRQFGCID